MTRLILAAGVAVLAIASAASAKPGGGGNPHNGGGEAPAANNGGGGKGHGGDGGPAFDGGGRGHGGGGFAAPAFNGEGRGHGGRGFAAPQMRAERQQFRAPELRIERQQARGFERRQARAIERQQGRGFEHQQARRMDREQPRAFERQQARRMEREQPRALERQQARIAGRAGEAQRQAVATNLSDSQRTQAFRNAQTAFAANGARGLIDGCPPGLWMKNNGCMPPGQAAKLLGQPLSAASAIAPLYALPQSVNYLYPDTPDYYYRYGDGYLYQVNRGTNLIDSLLPLIGGGYAPGQYLPQSYMGSYVPDYYGMNAFYPDYGDTCNRYGNGVVYEVDCATGYVEDVIPTYASGYGVGQMLPSAYSYYNVPTQYRSMYYDTPDNGYWYAPGAIYQYDPRSSMITSVAALLAPGFTVGQPLPMGYDAYNVPYDYRSTYYDTPNAMYRYNNGNIYQVDPVTQIVTAIVASLLT